MRTLWQSAVVSTQKSDVPPYTNQIGVGIDPYGSVGARIRGSA